MEALVGIVMGSRSDLSVMSHAESMLSDFAIGYESRVVSAHRTPDRLAEYGREAELRGLRVIIAGAGGAAHLAGMMASYTSLPVLGVPIGLKDLGGIDSLLSIMQMPAGVPVGTLAIGESGAKNAAILAAQILALSDDNIAQRVKKFRADLTSSVPESVRD